MTKARRKRIVLVALAAILAGAAVALVLLWDRLANPRHVAAVANEAEAERALASYLEYRRACAPSDLPASPGKDVLDAVSLEGTPLEGRAWAFGVKNPECGLTTDDVYLSVYIVTGNAPLEWEAGTRSASRRIATPNEDMFGGFVLERPPTTEAEAFELARCYAALSLRSPPRKLAIIEGGSLPKPFREWPSAQTIAKEIHGPLVVARGRGQHAQFSVSFCAWSPYVPGEIYSWRFLVGPGTFIAPRPFPIHFVGPRSHM